jgi:hypothetical protein
MKKRRFMGGRQFQNQDPNQDLCGSIYSPSLFRTVQVHRLVKTGGYDTLENGRAFGKLKMLT